MAESWVTLIGTIISTLAAVIAALQAREATRQRRISDRQAVAAERQVEDSRRHNAYLASKEARVAVMEALVTGERATTLLLQGSLALIEKGVSGALDCAALVASGKDFALECKYAADRATVLVDQDLLPTLREASLWAAQAAATSRSFLVALENQDSDTDLTSQREGLNEVAFSLLAALTALHNAIFPDTAQP